MTTYALKREIRFGKIRKHRVQFFKLQIITQTDNTNKYKLQYFLMALQDFRPPEWATHWENLLRVFEKQPFGLWWRGMTHIRFQLRCDRIVTVFQLNTWKKLASTARMSYWFALRYLFFICRLPRKWLPLRTDKHRRSNCLHYAAIWNGTKTISSVAGFVIKNSFLLTYSIHSDLLFSSFEAADLKWDLWYFQFK